MKLVTGINYLLSFIAGILVGILLIITFVDIGVYCLKYSEAQQSRFVSLGYDQKSELLEIYTVLPNDCGGSTESSIEVPIDPMTREYMCNETTEVSH